MNIKTSKNVDKEIEEKWLELYSKSLDLLIKVVDLAMECIEKTEKQGDKDECL